MSIDRILAQLKERISDPNFPPAKINGEISNGFADFVAEVAPLLQDITQFEILPSGAAISAEVIDAGESETSANLTRAFRGYQHAALYCLLKAGRLWPAQKQHNNSDERTHANS